MRVIAALLVLTVVGFAAEEEVTFKTADGVTISVGGEIGEVGEDVLSHSSVSLGLGARF